MKAKIKRDETEHEVEVKYSIDFYGKNYKGKIYWIKKDDMNFWEKEENIIFENLLTES